MSMYPFKFKLGDFVTVLDGFNKNEKGKVEGLELTSTKTVAIIRITSTRLIRESEKNIRIN